MGPVASANIHFFLVILLMFLFLKGLDTVPGYCPVPCHCTFDVLNCSRVGNSPGLHHVPLSKPAAHPHVFFFLDFTGNAISSLGKQVWKAYPWTENLVLKGNSLSSIENTSLVGLLSLTHLDLSRNKIRVIQRNAFEAVPFLQFINFSGNVLERITPGAFKAWHGMQFLLKLDLSHNPLVAIEDDYFYRLPSLKVLDLSATEITPKVLVNILRFFLRLKKLILSNKMFCCLCRIKDDIEVLSNTVKLYCTNTCHGKIEMCEEKSLTKMKKEVMKVLEVRKMNTSKPLSIMYEKQSQYKNKTLVPTVSKGHPNVSDRTPPLWKSVKELNKIKADKFLHIKWTDKTELIKLYMLAELLRTALKEKIAEAEKNSQKIQNDTSTQASVDVSTDKDKSVDAELRNKRHLKKVKRDVWLGKKQQRKGAFLRFGRSRREFARAIMHYVKQSNYMHGRTWQLMKLVDDQDPESAASLLSYQEAAPFSKELTTSIAPFTVSVILDNKSSNLTGKLIIDLKKPNEPLSQPVKIHVENKANSQPVFKEELYKVLLNEDSDTSKLPADNSGASSKELSPDIVSHELQWEHHKQKTTIVHPRLDNTLPTEDDYLLQGDLFEAALNERLITLIPNAPMRNLIAHVIRILKMDCSEPKIQLACAKLISRTGLLMKLFSQKEHKKQSPTKEKAYFWPLENNVTTASPRNLEKPEIAIQEISEYEHGNKLLLAVSVTAVIIITIAVICLIEICSQRSAAKDGTSREKRTFFGRKKKSTEQTSSADSLRDKPLWLKDSYESMDEAQRDGMAGRLHDEASSGDEHIYSWTRPVSPPVIEKPPSGKPSLKTVSQTAEVPPAKSLSTRTLPPISALEPESKASPEVPPSPPAAPPSEASPPPAPIPETETSGSKPESSGGESSKGGSSSGGSEED